MNTVHLIGRVGRDPELRRTNGSGQAVVNLLLATNEVFSDKEGRRRERTEWHKLVCWGKTAELADQHVRKGDRLGVEGKLQSRSWRDNAGQARTTVEVNVLRLHFLGGINPDGAPEGGGEDMPF